MIASYEGHGFNRLLKYKNIDKYSRIHRNLIAKIIKEARKRVPFTPEDYSEAKKEWDDYHKMDNHIESIDTLRGKIGNNPVYITFYRKNEDFVINYPVKGNKPHIYYINGVTSDRTGCIQIFKCGIEKNSKYVKLTNVKSERESHGLSEDNRTIYRYSTPKEMAYFKAINVTVRELYLHIKNCETKIKELEDKIYDVSSNKHFEIK